MIFRTQVCNRHKEVCEQGLRNWTLQPTSKRVRYRDHVHTANLSSRSSREQPRIQALIAPSRVLCRSRVSVSIVSLFCVPPPTVQSSLLTVSHCLRRRDSIAWLGVGLSWRFSLVHLAGGIWVVFFVSFAPAGEPSHFALPLVLRSGRKVLGTVLEISCGQRC